ncbi:hypothetical protein L226DRAFT_571194 [Lentinus tigrinus ALCF2SS1-7]|uniref:uncharacterized protein n=1 Tax=Lentinus tigrinus ALCF2SS1-7 TaxID=1328758 RepID=UPI0011660840|nr:hypothetical protein L226DRAFT_571194 [Lentinus tigrinus ALCF2SS1-7]
MSLSPTACVEQPFLNPKGWGALATELRVRILQELNATDLLSCLKVNRAFKTLVDGTPPLRYKYLLYVAGMRDGPPGGSSVSKRLTQLEEYENTWIAKDIPVQHSGLRFTYKGGVFIVLDHQRFQLHIQRPASLFSGIHEKTWTVDLSDLLSKGGPDPELISSYDVDVAQDLLVLTVLPEDEDDGFPECYVLSLSQNGATHPLAAHRKLDGGSCLGLSSPQGDVEIVGELIGWTVLGMDICMNVYNWKTGAAVWYDSEYDESDMYMGDQMEYHTRCHILDTTHVLKISKYDLTVHRFGDYGHTSKLVCNLQMPPLAQGYEASYCESYILRPPQTPDCSPSFECDPSFTVLVVEYDIHLLTSGAWSPKDGAMLLAILPIATIIDEAHRDMQQSLPASHTRKVPWEDWGALGARLVLVPYQRRCDARVHVFGSRVAVTMPRLSPQQNNIDAIPLGMVEVAVFDVRKGAECAAGSGGQGAGTSPFLVLDKFTDQDTPIFKGPVEAKMPYRMVRRQYEYSQHKILDASLLCDGLCD